MNQEELNRKATEFWNKEFHNARRFFESEGNIETKDRLKIKWVGEFFEGINELGRDLLYDSKPIRNSKLRSKK